ncbi:MAG: DUF1707 domain-containing protein [Alteromonadaceae bacterium]|nr:DUF1707 domain-containing protein [Alteromonadaceae bacterium]
MPVNIEDRPIETVREEVVDQLVMNYSHGEISYEAFERRLDTAMESQNNKEIVDLVADLDLTVDKKYIEQKTQDFSVNYTPGETDASDKIINIFSSGSRSGAWNVAKEIHIYSFCSGADIDFTDAIFTHPTVTVKLFSLFSGDTIYVPENINIVSKAFCIVGSIDSDLSSNASPNAPTIVIEGFSIFSGVTIKVKRTIKEKFVAFADNLKKMFS